MKIEKDKYIFFLDIDNTLFVHGEIPQKNLDAIKRVRAEGHKVFINTARSYACIPDIIKNLDIDGIVAGLGCSIRVDKKRILCKKLPIDEVAEVFDYFTNRKKRMLLEGEEIMVENMPFYSRSNVVVESGKELKKLFSDGIFAKFYLPGKLDDEETKFASDRYMFFQHKSYAEFSPKGHTKASGISVVADYYGADISQCVAMGDSLNDVDMLKAAGISVAMGDAVPEVKKMCDIVTCDAADGGVAEAMYKITGIKYEITV